MGWRFEKWDQRDTHYLFGEQVSFYRFNTDREDLESHQGKNERENW